MRVVSLLALAFILPTIAYASLVNINTANATLLDTLPGIGPSKAAAIIDYRTKNGLFAAVEDIQKVSGIGPITFANMKEFITVDAPAPSLSEGAGLQPTTPVPSLNKVQEVENIISPQANIQKDEKAVIAPSPVLKTGTGEGAALSASPAPSRASGLFRSPWTLGLLGVILVAGSAFIFL